MRTRRAPRSLSDALDRLRAQWIPATLLAAVQRVWEDVVGAALAREAEPVGRARRGAHRGLLVVAVGPRARPHGTRSSSAA